MPTIPITTPLGYIGVFFVIAGFFLVIAGIELIKIEKLTITPGRKTWGFGLLLAAIGVLFLLPEIKSPIIPSPAPTLVDTVGLNMTSPLPASTSTFAVTVQPTSQLSLTSRSTIAPIVQPTSANIIPLTEATVSIPLTLMAQTAASESVACISSQTGTGAPVEVQADTLKAKGPEGNGLQLVSGELIPFSIMRNFEVDASEYPDHLRVTITLLNGDTVTDDARYPWDTLTGKAKYGLFSIILYELRRVEFQQGGCQ